MWNDLKLYLRYVQTSVRSQMQYRASFLMLSVGQFLAIGAELLAMWALFDRFGNLNGWSFAEVAAFFGIANIAFAISEAVVRGFDMFEGMVKSGDFDRLLVRPRSTALQVAAREFQLTRFGRLGQGLLALLVGAAYLDTAWSPGKVILLLGAVLGGACLFSGLFVLQATLAFWTTESLEIVNTVTYGGVETAQYPLEVYRPWFRVFFTAVVPLACVSYFPATVILERADTLATPIILLKLSPLVGVAFLALSLQVWKLGVRHYTSTGS